MALASALLVFVGSSVITWDQLVEASSHWQAYDYYAEFELAAQHHRLEKLNELRRQKQGVRANLDLIDVLNIGRNSHATNARDHIYALVGLMTNEDKSKIQVDYGKSVASVYSEMTAILVKCQSSLDFIVGSFDYHTDRSQRSLPSWVVDYGSYEGSPIAPSWGSKSHHHRASGQSEPSTRYDEPNTKIEIRGVYFDKITASTSPFEHPLHDWTSRARDTRWGDCLYEWLPSWIVSAYRVWSSSLGRKIPPTNSLSTLIKSRDFPEELYNNDFDFRYNRSWCRACLDRIVADGGRPYSKDELQELSAQYDSSEEYLPDSSPSSEESSTFTNDENESQESSAQSYPHERRSSDMRLAGEDLPLFANLEDDMPEGHPEESPFQSVLGDIRVKYEHDTFFATNCGFIGSASIDPRGHRLFEKAAQEASTCEGDIIVVPQGASMPWVLRPSEQEGEFRLISECRVNGIMKGELMELVKAGKLHSTWFTLVNRS